MDLKIEIIRIVIAVFLFLFFFFSIGGLINQNRYGKDEENEKDEE